MANVGTQTLEGLEVDLAGITRALKRAKRNTERPRARNAEIVALWSRLQLLYTEETTGAVGAERRAVGE